MIKRVSANKPSFKTVELTGGFNVIWADRTQQSSKRDTRNGLGKSTLIEIIHFCLGAQAQKRKGLLVQALTGWAFSIVIELNGKDYVVTRGIDKPNEIKIEGDTSNWPIKPKTHKGGERVFSVRDWNGLLGNLFYNLPIESEGQYQPAFRSLLSYNVRRGKDAYTTPFEYYRKQPEWSRQVHNAFLLNLAWTDACDLQLLKDRKKGLDNLKKAAEAGVVTGLVGSLGELEARRVRLQKRADIETESLASFQVHPQYADIRVQANQLTEKIHAEANKNAADQRILSLYESALAEESQPVPNLVEKLYADAGVSLPNITLRRIEDVQTFHRTIIHNRKEFLAAEVARLKRDLSIRDDEVKTLSDRRAQLMTVLQTHGALEEYTQLQKKHLDTISDLNAVNSSIQTFKTCETGLSRLKIDQEMLQQKARRDYDDRRIIWEKAVELFNSYTERLYSVPGRLIIDVTQTGYKFDVEIERSGSGGVGNMKVFCYDMTIASLLASKSPSPRVLIHDSIIFDGVDERQRAVALEIAAAESEKNQFQYICTLNSDEVPWQEFSPGFDLRKFVKATLTDDNISGSLLGLRF